MPAATGDIGYNTTIYYEANLGAADWVAIYQARNITLPKKTASKVDFTHLRSQNRTKEAKPGMGEWSSASFEALYDYSNSSQGQILADTNTYPQRNFKVELRNSQTDALEETWSWLGHVEEAGLGQMEADGARVLQASIAVDGAVVIA